MRIGLKMGLAALVALAVGVSGQAALLIDLTAEDFVSVLNDGEAVPAWVNHGTLGSEFRPVGSGTGTVYNDDVAGIPAVSFVSATWTERVMTNMVSPNAICGRGPWAFEIWIYKPAIYGDEAAFAWTGRNQWPNNSAAGTCMEFRYGSNAGIAIEHNGNDHNIPWGATSPAVPAVGQWHHVAGTRDASGVERLYVDGAMWLSMTRTGVNIRNDLGYFSLSGVRNMDNANHDQIQFRGSIARLRIYDTTLPPSTVIGNYLSDCAAMGFTPQPQPSEQPFVWAGAAGTPAAWDTAGNWFYGVVPTDGKDVHIENGGIAEFSGVNTFANFYGFDGGLHMSGGLLAVANPPAGVNMGTGPGAAFDFALTGGKFHIMGAANPHLYLGRDGGSGSAVIGGGSELAWLCADGAVQVGKGIGGDGYMEVLANGLVTVSNNTLFATAEGATGTVVVAGGEIRGERGTSFNLGHGAGAQAKLIVNSGMVRQFGDVSMSSGGQNASSLAELYLNGGLVWVSRVIGNDPAVNIVYMNGGTFRNRDNRQGANADQGFLCRLTAAYVQAGGACFDVIANTTIEINPPLVEDPNSPGGGLTKTGPGTLQLRGASTFTGDIVVRDGHLRLLTAESLPSGVANVLLEAPGRMGYDVAGGAAALLGLIDKASTGALMLYGNNLNESLDLSQHPNLALSIEGSGEYTGSAGTYTPANNVYRFIAVSGFYKAVIPQNASVVIEAASQRTGWIVFEADNQYTGGTTINGGVLEMRHANALGYQAAPGVRDIGIYNGAALKFNNNVNAAVVQSIIARIKTDSYGVLLITTQNNMHQAAYDLSQLPGISFSSDTGAEYDVSLLTPYVSDIYRLGGGQGDWRSDGLKPKNMADDGVTPRSLLIDFPGNPVRLWTNNTFTGGIVVTNGGAVSMREITSMGGALGAPRADFVRIDGGCLRPNTDGADVPYGFTLPDHGLWVGDGGVLISTPDNRGWVWQGGLSGTGPITNTVQNSDRGLLMFGGANNTWEGTLTINSNSDDGGFAIGWGSNFSWVKTNLIEGNGMFGVATDLDITWSDAFENPLGNVTPNFDAPDGTSAILGLRKLGAGTLTLDMPNTYRRMTRVDSGILKVGAADTIPYGANKGNLHVNNGNIFPAGTFDLNGFGVNVNGLNGAGDIIDSTGAGATLTIGNANQGGTFLGTVAAPAKLFKTGDGTETFWKGADVNALSVQRRTVTTGAETTFGSVSLFNNENGINASITTFNVGLAATDEYGLTGEYYWFNDDGMRSRISPAYLTDIDAFDALLAPYAPLHVQSSFSFGEGFDAGYSGNGAPGSKFQGNFNNRANHYGRWTGEFYAEADGEYIFATSSDDGSCVFIDRQPAITNCFDQAYTYRAGVPVYLAQGWHDIVIGHHQAGGDRGLTVFFTPPGGEEAVLPQRLLRPYPVTVGALSGEPSSRVDVHGNMALSITGEIPSAYTGRLVAASADARLIKSGAADFVLAWQDVPEFNGQVTVSDGTLGLISAYPFTQPIRLAAGTELAVLADDADVPNIGLRGTYYNVNYSGGPTSYPTMRGYFSTLVPTYYAYTTQTGAVAVANAPEFWYTERLFPGPYSYEYPPTGNKEQFRARFQGKFLALEPGDYTFGFINDDRAELFIDGVMVLLRGNASNVEITTTVYLDAGSHDFQVLWGQGGSGYYIGLTVMEPHDTRTKRMPNALLRPSVSTVHGVEGDGSVALRHAAASLRFQVDGAPQVFDKPLTGVSGSEIEKNGDETMTLVLDNDGFHGGWLVMKGTLVVGDGGVSGSLGNSDHVYVSEGARLVFNRADDIVFTGTISGCGEICNIGGGRVTLCNMGDDFKGVFSAGDFVITGDANVQAASLAQGPDPASVRFEDGARLLLPPSSESVPALIPAIFSNATLTLSYGETNAYYIDTLMIQAGGEVNVEPTWAGGVTGLYGYYYEVPGNTDPKVVSPYFTSLETGEAYLKGFPLLCKASTWEAGDTMDFADNGSLFPQPAKTRNTYFGAIWKGKIRIDVPGFYTFTTRSDDNSMLYIDNALLVDNNNDHGMQDRSGVIELTAGTHDFALLYYQGGSGYGLRVSVTLPGGTSQYLPNLMLFADPADTVGEDVTGIPFVAADFTLEVGTLGVVDGPGIGTIDIASRQEATMTGTLLLNDLFIESAGAVLAAVGDTKLAGGGLRVIMGSEPPSGKLIKVGDFTQAPNGLPLIGKTLTLEGAKNAKPLYKPDACLYVTTSVGTVLILR
ncbi:MAG: PA14 domain-containing protein [Kiritimatiellaeota bacterium]|nr:PA14 domain-containing protein [Kiritimatiellota bacterium]